MEPTILDASQKHILTLIHRDKKPDGWTSVSPRIYRALFESIPTALATFEPLGEFGRVRLTRAGQQVIDAMNNPWLFGNKY